MLRTVQRAKEATEKVIAAARQLKQSLMRHLFTYGPVPFQEADQVELQETEIGEIPNHWAVKPLSQVARIERGKFAHRPRNDPRFYGGAIPFIQTGDVARCDGRIREYTQTLNEEGLLISRIFPKGTIVLTIAANICDVGILDFDSAFPDSLVGITPIDNVGVEYLAYYLQMQKVRMNQLAPRGTQKNINIAFLGPWPVPVASREEQHQITNAIYAMALKIEAEEARRNALGKLFSSLLHNLMTGQIRVHDLGLPVKEEAA